VSRAASSDGPRPNTVRLTADEREIAKSMGLTDVEYAKNKLDLQREGLMN
jgi:phage I-like protein